LTYHHSTVRPMAQGTLEKGRMGSRRRRRTQTNPISLCAPWLWRALALQMASRGWRRRKLVYLDLKHRGQQAERKQVDVVKDVAALLQSSDRLPPP
jgi:hypothetical protein